jgi:hypothetical protein
MPFLPETLDVALAATRLRAATARNSMSVTAARLTRHKPGRRFMVEYDVDDDGRALTLIGKARAKGLDRRTFELQRRLYESSFGPEGPDGICVPATAGAVPEWHMWLQHKVPGRPLNELLFAPDAAALCARAADAARRFQSCGIETDRRHTIEDELQILLQCLGEVARWRPELVGQLDRVCARCEQWAASIPSARRPSIVHRDFYPDQLIVNAERMYLVDLDLHCLADPCLDVGNFCAHVTELALRITGDPARLDPCASAAREQFVRRMPGDRAATIRAVGCWERLSLARHIYISTRFADRQVFTDRLIELTLAA